MMAMLSSIVMQSSGQFFLQSEQPMQPARQFSLTTLPLSFELHMIRTLDFSEIIVIKPLGHASMHLPQATHFTSSISAMLSVIFTASNGHAFLQLSSPMQAYVHDLLPPIASWDAARQFVGPL
jgi:hypothetical protein